MEEEQAADSRAPGMGEHNRGESVQPKWPAILYSDGNCSLLFIESDQEWRDLSNHVIDPETRLVDSRRQVHRVWEHGNKSAPEGRRATPEEVAKIMRRYLRMAGKAAAEYDEVVTRSTPEDVVARTVAYGVPLQETDELP